ncbi:MAG: polysaccharide deacetylase family protein, partial [Ruminococcus sp.]|nr:polysaccharide deacetylase family protein [Ruminococcus sp.]
MKEFTNSDNKNAGKQPQGVDSRTTKIWIPGKERAKTAALDQSGQQPAQTRKRPSQRKPAAQAQKPTAKQAAAQPTPASQPVRKRPAERKAAQQPVVSAIAAPAAKEAKPAPQKAPQTAKTKKAKEKKPVEKIDRKQLVRPQLPPQEEQLPTEQAAEAAAKDPAAHMAQEPKLEERIKKKIKRDIKARKKRVIVIPIIIASLLFLSVFGVLATRFMARVNLGTVENTYIHETTSFSLTLAWDAVENAEGYHVYQKKENSEDYQQIDSTENLYDIVYGLQQATTYSFYVKAYSGTYESRDFIPVENVYTIPNSGNITEIYSASSGTIHVGWQGNNRADGYLLEFRTAGRDYREENRIMIERTDSTEYNITSLKANDVIGVRVSSYFIHEGEKIFGEPSVEHEIKVSDGTSRHTEQARSTEKMIALTFDDGPLDGTSGDRILDVLEKYNAKATFYMVGSAVEGHQENVKRKAALGMELGNHSYSHDYYGDELPAEEI